ncbi:MAG: hypothetical protein ABI867_30440, partial [Kofleriaceae bacterium]
SPERAALLDRAIDELEALIDTPIDPGNDEGPFWQIAGILDERQVRRALAIVDRMDAPKWCYHLAGSRSELAIRLAWLGHWRDATAQLAHMRHDSFADSWRAQTTGGIIAARLGLDANASASELLPEVAGESRWRVDVVTGLVHALREQPQRTERVDAFVDYARAITDATLRTYALELLAGAWVTALPAARWLAMGVAPLVLAEAIHDAGGDPTDVLVLAPRDAASFEELCELRAYLAPASCMPAFAAWLRTSTRLSRFDLAAVLVWLGGPEALLAVGRAIIRAG